MVERFQLFCFVCAIVVQNLSAIGLVNAQAWLYKNGAACLLMLFSECVVDWIKHGFMTKFNFISPLIYRKFRYVLCGDFTTAHVRKHLNDSAGSHTHAVSRRIGFVSLPLGCLALRVCYHAAMLCEWSSFKLTLALVALVYVIFVLLKVLLSIVLLGHAAKFVASMRASLEARSLHAAKRPSVAELDKLEQIDRYALSGNDVPM